MEQQQAQQVPPAASPPMRLMAVTAVAVVAVLVLSALVVVFYVQAVDYRDSKYRAQFQTVNEMVTFLPLVNDTVGYMLDTTLEIGERRAMAFSSIRMAEMLAGDALSLSIMYDRGDDRYSSLFALGGAFSGVAMMLYDGYTVLSSPSHVLSDGYVQMVKRALGIMTAVNGYLGQGLLADVDGFEDPYHVVGGMPIGSIASAAATLTATVSQ